MSQLFKIKQRSRLSQRPWFSSFRHQLSPKSAPLQVYLLSQPRIEECSQPRLLSYSPTSKKVFDSFEKVTCY